MLTLCFTRNRLRPDTLFKKAVALMVLVWSKGQLVTLQILTSSFLLLEETHGSLGQCVNFSVIDAGIVLVMVVSCLQEAFK